MKTKKLLLSVLSLISSTGLVACGGAGTSQQAALTTALNMKDEAIYEIDLDNNGTIEEDEQNLTWADSYDAAISKIKASDDETYRFSMMHKAETLLMSTGAACPLYYYTNNYLIDPNIQGFYASPLGYKFFDKATFKNDATKKDITVCLASEPTAVDPALNSTVDGASMDSHLFAGLYRYNNDGSGNATLAPDLAKEAPTKTKNADGSVTYTFTLRDGIKFSDGTDIKASDFVKSWKRAAGAALGADYSYMFDMIKGHEETGEIADDVVVADDEAKTLKVTLETDVPYFYEIMAFPAYMVIKDADKTDVVDNKGSWAMSAGFVTSGAYTIKSWTHNQIITMERNEYYYGNDDNTMDTINFALSDSETNMYANFKSGAYQLIDSLSPETIQIEKNNDCFRSQGQLGTYYISFNTNSPIFTAVADTEAKREKVRIALGYLIDRESLITAAGNGATAATSFVPTGLTDPEGGEFVDHNGVNGDGSGYISYDPEVGIELLKEVGYTFDESKQVFTDFPTFTYLYNTSEGHKVIAECIQSDLKTYGIDVTLKNQEWNTFVDTRNKGQCDVSRNGWLADYNDPISFLDMFISGSGNNVCQLGKQDMWSK